MAKFDPVGAFQTGQGLGIKTQIQLGAYNEGVKQKLATEAARAVDYEEGLLRQTIDNFAEAYGSQQVPENSPFANAEEFNAFATDFYNNRKGNIQPKDFISIYGKQGGLEKLNSMGFSSAMLGFGKEIDINNSKFNEAGELEPFVRTADPKRGKAGQFYSAPLTLGGKPIRQVIQEFGTEGVPDNTTSFTLDTLNQPYDTFKRDIRIGAGGTPALQFMGKASNVKWFDPSPEARQEREETLFVDPTTSDQSTPTGEGAPTTPPPPSDTTTPMSMEGRRVGDALGDRGVNSQTKKTALLKDYKPYEEFGGILDVMGVDSYYNPKGKAPFGYTEEEFQQQFSPNERALLMERSQKITEQSISRDVNLALKNLRRENFETQERAGVDDATAAQMQQSFEFTRKNRKKLKELFAGNEALYNEYMADPKAFGIKYTENDLFPKISSEQRKVINDAAKSVGATGNTVPTAVQSAINNSDGPALVDALKQEIGNNQGNIDSQTQSGLVAVLQDNNNNLVMLDQARRYKMALAITASLTDTQLSSAYGQGMLNFIEYGTLGGLSDQKQALAVSKYRLDLAKYSADGLEVSDNYRKLFDEIVNFESEGNKWGDDDYRRYAAQIGVRLQEAAGRGSQGRGDLAVATSQAGALLDIYLAKNAGPSAVREFFTLGFAEDPTYGGFNLSPDVVGIDANNQITTDPTKITQVQKSRTVGDKRRLIGKPISLREMEEDLPGATAIVKELVLANAGGS